MDLNFFIEPSGLDLEYPTETPQKPHTKHEFLNKISKIYTNEFSSFVDKKISNRYIVNTAIDTDRHLLVLDVDGEDNLTTAIISLERRNIQYEIIKSSEGNHWLITDFIASFDEVYHLLKTIPGVDDRFVAMARIRRYLNLRAVNRGGIFPEFLTDSEELGKESGEWYAAFRTHFDELQHAYKDIKLRKALKDGSIGAYLADPSVEA